MTTAKKSVSDKNHSILAENWNNARSNKSIHMKESGGGRSSAEASTGVVNEREPLDINLLFAYFVLTCAITFVVYIGGLFLLD